MEKMLNRFIGDERVRRDYGRAAIITLFLMWGYMVVRMLLTAMGIWETDFIRNDLYFVMISYLVFSFIAVRQESDTLIYSPIFRKEMPYKEGRFFGRLPFYIGEAVVGAIILTVIIWLVEGLVARDFAIDAMWFVSNIIAYTIILIFILGIMGEIRVRRFRRMEEEE